MNDCNIFSLPNDAAAVIPAYRRVAVNASGKAVLSGAGDTKFLGTSKTDSDGAVPSKAATAIQRRTAGVHWATYGSATALAPGDELEAIANGKVDKKNAGTAIGVALEAASADGAIIRVTYY